MLLPLQLRMTCRRLGVVPTRFVLIVRARSQVVHVLKKTHVSQEDSSLPLGCGSIAYRLCSVLSCSTSRFGLGQQKGSNQTPLGLHRVAARIGGGWPIGTVFRNRRPVGYTWHGRPGAPIVHRILWLDGLEPAFNRGGQVDSHARYIYIHGVGDETTIGRPTSHGCIHLAASHLIPLFDRLQVGTLVWIVAE
jgi:hypothetical protein